MKFGTTMELIHPSPKKHAYDELTSSFPQLRINVKNLPPIFVVG